MTNKAKREVILKELLEYNEKGYKIILDCCFYEAPLECAELLVNKKETLIFYESPHRIIRTLEILLASLGNRKACVARELTKLNEEYIRGTLEELSQIDEATLKGEMVIVIEGSTAEEKVSDEELIKRYNELIKKGVTNKVSAEIVSEEFNVNKNYVKSLTMNKN